MKSEEAVYGSKSSRDLGRDRCELQGVLSEGLATGRLSVDFEGPIARPEPKPLPALPSSAAPVR